MTDERKKQTPIIVECLLEMGYGTLISDGADLDLILELIWENYLNGRL